MNVQITLNLGVLWFVASMVIGMAAALMFNALTSYLSKRWLRAMMLAMLLVFGVGVVAMLGVQPPWTQ